MDRKLVLALLLAVLAAGGLWFALREGEGGRGAAPAATSSTSNAQSPESSNPPVELDAPAGASAAPVAEAQRSATTPEAARGVEHESFALADARWVDVTVVLPAGVPAGDEPALVGFARKDGLAQQNWSKERFSEALGLDDSFAHELEGEHHWARRPLAPSVRMPFPANAKQGVLFVQSRYLHLDPVELALPAQSAVTIEPELGAFVTGRCTFPPERGAPASAIDLNFSGRARDQGLMGFAQPDSRNPRVRDDLTFELRALAASKKYAVVGKAKGFVGYFELSLELRPGEHRELTIPFRVGASIAGTVRGEGQPIQGAHVAVDARMRMPWTENLKADTDAQGAFFLDGLPSGKVTLAVSKEGWRESKSEPIEVVEGRSVSGIELVLESGRRISGSVHWPDGTPAAEAQVSASRQKQRWTETVASGHSDANGAFVLGGLTDEPVDLVASHAPRDGKAEPEPAPKEVDSGRRRGRIQLKQAWGQGSWLGTLANATPGSADLVLTLVEPLPVQGTVVDDTDKPVHTFSIAAYLSAHGEYAPESVKQPFLTEDGTFTVGVGLAAEWTFKASVDERSSEPVTLNVPQNGAALRLVVPRASSVSGTVVDPAGKPVAGAAIHHSETSQQVAYARFSGADAKSDADGRFTLATGKSGGFVHATHEDWAASEPVALEVAPGAELADLVLHLRVGARVTGEVFDAEGKPQVGQNVNCSSGAAGMAFMGGEHSTLSDGAGRFAFEHVTPGKITVTALPSEEELVQRVQSAAEDGGGEQAMLSMLSDMRTASVEVADGAEAHVLLGTKPKKPVRVHGLVTEGGSPVPDKQVFAFAEGAALLQGMKLAHTDADGRYELVLDRPGDYVLGVGESFDSGAGSQFYVAVPEVTELEQDLTIPLGRIAGVVLGPDGPAAGVPMRLVSSEGQIGLEDLSESNRTSSENDGGFAFEHLRPGVYALEVGSSVGFGSSEVRFGKLVVDGLRVERDRATDGLVVHLAKPGKLAGIVRDTAGAPASGVTIFVRDSAGRAISSSDCTTDGSGRFTYDGIAPGRVTASARSSRFASGESAEVEVQSGETANVELTVSEGTFLRVSLLEDDQPVRARLRVLDDAGRRVDDLLSREDLMGLLSDGFSSRERRIGPLAPGRYSLVATSLDGKDAKTAVRIEAGQGERNVKMRLR